MNDDVSVRVLHTRMAVASWIFPLLALFALAMAGETSLFVRRVPAYSDEHRLTYDMVILSLLLSPFSIMRRSPRLPPTCTVRCSTSPSSLTTRT